MRIPEMSDEELIKNATELYCSINVVECYGTRDLLFLEWVLDELNRRGYKFIEEKSIKIEKR
jgi:hypothetical protein